MLENYTLPQPNNNNLTLQTGRRIGLFIHIDRECLSLNSPGGKIGKGVPITWPPCSPDLKLLDAFFVTKWKTRCRAKEWTRRMNSELRPRQQLRMLQRTRYSAPGSRCTSCLAPTFSMLQRTRYSAPGSRCTSCLAHTFSMLQRTRYSAPGSRRAAGGVYAGLEMMLVLKCSTRNNISMCVQWKDVSTDE
jgi:hypothetical protein